MVQILGITKEKIVYIKENSDGKKGIRFHHIQYGKDGIEKLCQFFEFENGFREGVGKRYGQYIYCLLDGKLLRVDILTEEIMHIETDAKRFVFGDECVVLMKKEERWKNYVIVPPGTTEVFFCNLFDDGADESIMSDVD